MLTRPGLAFVMRASPALRLGAVLLLFCTLFGFQPQSAAGSEGSESLSDQPVTQAAFTVYMPLLSNGQATQPPPPPPPPADNGFFVEPERKTSRPGVAIDAQGGSHMAYRYHVPYAQHPQAVYAYCPPPASQCADPAKWGRVAFLDRVEEVQIELTPAGQPRLLILIGDADGTTGSIFAYAECNTNCLAENSWSVIGVQTKRDMLGSVTSYYTPRRSFELDPQGRPRFVYYDYNYQGEPDHIGGFYLWCDANCTEEGTWNETLFTQQYANGSYIENESISDPVLKFTRDGQPRILSYLNPLGNGANGSPLRFDLYYIGCDSGCEDSANWQRVQLIERGSGFEPAWDLELDPNSGNPRAVNYQSGERKLFYHWCDGDCFNAGSWNSLNMRNDGWGVGADLELDAQGRPRLALLNTARGLGMVSCDSGCAQIGSWRENLVETLDELDAEYPVARPVTCNNGLWYVYAPSLVFDPQGKLHVIYDAEYQAKCQYVDPTQPAPITDVFHEIWHSVRYVNL